jgi:hypothetical protein
MQPASWTHPAFAIPAVISPLDEHRSDIARPGPARCFVYTDADPRPGETSKRCSPARCPDPHRNADSSISVAWGKKSGGWAVLFRKDEVVLLCLERERLNPIMSVMPP